MQVEIDRDVVKALYERLLKPGKDADGNVIYTISITLANELRNAIFSAALEGKVC